MTWACSALIAMLGAPPTRSDALTIFNAVRPYLPTIRTGRPEVWSEAPPIALPWEPVVPPEWIRMYSRDVALVRVAGRYLLLRRDQSNEWITYPLTPSHPR
jgi:hypothetical protein